MKRMLLLSVLSIGLFSCEKNAPYTPDVIPANPSNNHVADMRRFMRYSGVDYSQPILIDTANKMIESYLYSIGYPEDENNLRSLTFDADTLRAYLNDDRIVTMKFMLAHTLGYIHNGGYGEYAGMNAAALTLVLVGLDNDDNYIYNGRNMVYDHFTRCPEDCPNSSDVLSQ